MPKPNAETKSKPSLPPKQREAAGGTRVQRRAPAPRAAHPVIPLYPYQRRWIEDRSRFKLAVKATQIGYSFAAALEAVLDCLERRTLWIVLSRGERQSREFLRKVGQHLAALRIACESQETGFFDGTEIRELSVQFPNGSRILGLPANPDTARGYTGNLILDEFAFHQQDREIWAAAFGRVSRGALKLRVISTPNGQRGKFYELAKECGLAEPPRAAQRASARPARSGWSGHWCDVHTAVAEGCPLEVAALRRAVGDEQTWRQEYECAFLSGSDNYIPLERILSCEDPGAAAALPPDWERGRGGEFYFGYDVARVGDLAVLAVIEKVGDVCWTRGLIEMPSMTFSDQEKILSGIVPHCLRGAVDATGLGLEMAERLAARFPGKIEPVRFTATRKQEMAVGMKRHFEDRTLRIPEYPPLRRDLNAVKRAVTAAGNIRFDAERTEEGHADRFWALALALSAAARAPQPLAAGAAEEEEFPRGAGWIASRFSSPRAGGAAGEDERGAPWV
ncbi:MAG TPA: terminase family protein [Terriglobia bacterium]|nr:terminase family protein [Terriglobia bacterium]